MSSKKTKIKFIAEIGINHNGNFSLAKKLIYEANKCGCDYVKFQIRNLNKIYHKNFKKNFTNSESAHQYIFNQCILNQCILNLYFCCLPLKINTYL